MSKIETKKEKFVRLAESRTNKIIDMIQLLGNCSNIAVYEYTDSEIDKIFSSIELELKIAKSRFKQKNLSGRDSRFKL